MRRVHHLLLKTFAPTFGENNATTRISNATEAVVVQEYRFCAPKAWFCSACEHVNVTTMLENKLMYEKAPAEGAAMHHVRTNNPQAREIDGRSFFCRVCQNPFEGVRFWVCVQCSKLNSPSTTSCSTCDSPRGVLWKCNECDCSNSVFSISCSRCGRNKVEENVEAMKNVVRCPSCSFLNEKQHHLCHCCLAPLKRWEEIAAVPEEPNALAALRILNRTWLPPISRDSSWLCLKCQSANVNKDKVCKECQEPRPSEFWQCSLCLSICSQARDRCIGCGEFKRSDCRPVYQGLPEQDRDILFAAEQEAAAGKPPPEVAESMEAKTPPPEKPSLKGPPTPLTREQSPTTAGGRSVESKPPQPESSPSSRPLSSDSTWSCVLCGKPNSHSRNDCLACGLPKLLS